MSAPAPKTTPAPNPLPAGSSGALAREALRERVRDATTRAELVAAVDELCGQLLGCEDWALLECADGARTLTRTAQRGEGGAAFGSVTVGAGALGRAAATAVLYRPRGEGTGPEAALTACAPLLDGGRVVGVLALFRLLPHKRALDDADLVVLRTLAVALGERLARTPGAGTPAALPPPQAVRLLASPSPSGPGSVYLHPGDLHVAQGGEELVTVLGSCVAVCLWSPELRAGGMNHFLLPLLRSDPTSLRSGEAAMAELLRRVTALGARAQRLEARVFGGARQSAQPVPGGAPSVGEQNAALALSALRTAGIPVLQEDLGGRWGRKLRFHTGTGRVQVASLQPGAAAPTPG